MLSSSSSSGSAGAPAPGGVQAQTVRGGGTYTQQSGFKYCFREVKDGQVGGRDRASNKLQCWLESECLKGSSSEEKDQVQ